MSAMWWRRLKRGALFAGLGLAALTATALLVFVSPLGRSLVTSTLMSALAGDGTARYVAVSGGWPGTLILDKITLADKDGPWLTLNRATLEWRPLALLRGELAITRLALDKPVLLRQPKPSPPKPSSGGGFDTSPPLPITLDSLQITDGLLQDGTPIGFAGSGALRWTKTLIALRTEILRQGGPDEHVRLSAGIDQATRRVGLSLDAVSLPAGLFARLARVSDLPEFHLTASGSGPAEAWQFKAAGAVGAYGALDLGGQLAWTDRLVLDLAGTLKPGAALGESWRGALGQTLTLKSRLSRIKGADSIQLALQGETLEAVIDGSLGAPALFGGRALHGQLRIDARKPVNFGARTAFGPGTVTGLLDGTLERPKGAFTVALETAHYGGYQISKLDGAVQVDNHAGIAIQGKGSLGALAVHDKPSIETASWSLAAVKDGDAIRDLHLTLASDALGLDATGALDTAKGSAEIDAQISSRDLAAISPLAHVRLAGETALAATLRRDAADADAMVTIVGTISHGAVAGQAFTPFASDTLQLDTALTRHPDGTLTLEKGLLSGMHLAASAKGRVAPTLDLPIAIKTDLSALGAFAGLDAKGAAEGQLLARGTLDDPNFGLVLKSRDAVLAGRSIGLLTILFEPDARRAVPVGRLRLMAQGPPGGMTLTLPIDEKAGLLVLGPLGGAAYGGRLAGTLREIRDGWAGRLDAKFADLSGLYSLATNEPSRMAGRGSASLILGPASDLVGTVVLRDVASADRKLAAVKLTVDASRKSGVARLVVNGQELRLPGAVGPIEARRLVVQGNGPPERFVWSLNADGFTTGQGTLDAAGSIASAASSNTIVLDTLRGQLWATPVALEDPARLTLRGNGMDLSPVALKIGTGRLRVDYSTQGAGYKGNLALSALPLEFIGRIIGADWPQGRITGQAGLDSLSARPSGFADLNFSDATFTRQSKTLIEPLAGAFTLRWDGRSLSVKGRADRQSTDQTPAAQPIMLDATLPLRRDAKGQIGFDTKGPVSGEVHWTGRLGTLWALLPFDLHRLDGDAVMNGRAFGRWGAPGLEGSLSVSHGSYESLMTGTRLTDIALKVDAGSAGGEATLQGGDGRGGLFSGRGHIDFGEAQRIDAQVTLKNLRIVGLDRLTAEASGPLSLSGSLKAPKLAGTLRIDHADASIPDRLPPSIPQLPVHYVDAEDATAPKFDVPDTGKNAALALALEVDIPGQAFLRGRGLTSEWRGHVTVEGTSLLPRVKGQVELVRGDLAFAGRSYPLSRGRVIFDGSTKVDPMLDIAATRNVDGSDIALAVAGPSSAPRLDLTSSPALPRDQAMSLFLFGKPAQSLTTLELLDVARSVASLTGQGGGFDPIEKTRRALGLDVLTVGVGSGTNANGTATDVASSATLQAGRYVSRRVYLGVKQGARTGSSAVQLNYALTPHLSAGTEVGVESGGQLNVNWKWDY